MRCTGPLGYALSGSAVLALLAGCSGGGSSSSPTPLSAGSQPQSVTRSVSSFARQGPQTTSVLRPGVNRVVTPDLSDGFADPDAAKKAAVIVSDSGTNDVYVYTTAGKLTATITGFNEPQGMGGDAAGDVYVADTGNSNILVYPNTYKKVKATLTDPGQYPVGVDVSVAGVVGVTNIISTSDGAGSVSFYAKGATSPCVTVANSNWGRVYFGAFDKAGNFYIDGESSGGAVLAGVVKGGCKAKAITTLTTSNAISFPGGVAVSPTGKIVIDDQSGAAIYTYNPPVKNSLGTPTTTPLTGVSDPVTFAFTKTATDLWTADAGLASSQEFKYPAGGSAIKSITGLTEPIGVVVTPLEVP
jgi:hypothetical protein